MEISTLISFFEHLFFACWNTYRTSAIYMLFGFLIAGFMHIFIRPEKIGAFLNRGTFRPVFLSALIGVPIPLCSCGVVPAAAGLRKQGASKGATLSFLISTPESGIDSISVTYALLDPIMTVVRPLCAFLTAMVAGMMENMFGTVTASPKEALKSCGCHSGCCSNNTISTLSANKPLGKTGTKLSSAMTYAFVDLLGDVGKWFIIGVLIAGLITLMIPDSFLPIVSQNRMLSIVLAMAAGIPTYVCATASTPIAAALILKGLNPGAALAFLLLGPATNMATISMVYGLLGKRSLFVYLGSMIGCTMLFGFLVDSLYTIMKIAPTATVGSASDIIPVSVEILASAVLGILLIYSISKSIRI